MTFAEILAAIGPDRPYNLHSHTQFCDGRADMEQFAAEAWRRGFSHYGFSPHSPTPFATNCNMKAEDVPAYLNEFRRLRDLYAGRVTLLCGMEIDYLDDNWGPHIDYFKELPLDYRIGSVHFIPSQDGTAVDVDGSAASFARKMVENFDDDLHYVVETFYDHTRRMIEAGGFDIIGHLDKIGHNADHYHPGVESEPWYRKIVDNIVELVIESGLTVEINTKSYADHRGRLFPSAALVRRLLKAGVPMIVSTDAHWPELIEASRQPALDLLKGK